MAPVCNRFVQNAWKKDMCSNCFRSKLEHIDTRIIHKETKKLPGPVRGIIKSGKKDAKKRAVSFSPNPVEVIGHGGEEWSDDEGVDEGNSSASSSEDDSVVPDDDKELERITKFNTDHNTNLLIQNSTEKRRTFTQLMLGKAQVDSEGNKQTLLVSVTPFGQEESKEKKVMKSHIPIAKNKEVLVEKKPNVVLTSYTKNVKEEVEKGKDEVDKKEEEVKEQVVEETKEIVEEVLEKEACPEIEELVEEPVKDVIKPASTINCELVKSRTELTIQLAPVLNDDILVKEDVVESDESCESIGILPKETREQAGEPDGRADPDIVNEPPALPLTPPPPLLNPRISFLHGSPKQDKPKVPSKPEKVLQLFKKATELPPIDPNKTPNKRRAPNPPPSPVPEQFPRSASLPEAVPPPEPAPRRTLSQENLLELDPTTKKPDKSTKSKFSLKKLLLRTNKPQDKTPQPPHLKPRLVIVHPLDLNGPLEVLKDDQPTPPAPPPRNLSNPQPNSPKPSPPPPKSEQIKQLQQQPSPPPLTTRSSSDNLYANLGEVRSSIAPCKPQRTASMREREALLEQRRRLQNKEEHLYERVTPRRLSEDCPNERQQNRFNKSTSLPSYNGSEMSIDNELIYSPCSYYGSESEIVDGSEWSGCNRPCKLRCRKGRSIVHKNLEDNYGAVVVANREALAQVLENLHQIPNVQPALRGLQTAAVLRWSDFAVVDGSAGVCVGKRSFYHGLWGPHHVTLALSREQGSMHKPLLGSFSMSPVTEFSDLIPAAYLPSESVLEEESNLIQATISVLPWLHIETIPNFGSIAKSRFTQGLDDVQQEVSFILLQLINGLKTLQAQGTEEVPLSLNNLVLCQDADRDIHHRLCLLQGIEDIHVGNNNEKLGSLCQCAMAALDELLPMHRLAPLIKCLLRKESSMSLSQVKSVLEFSLWGPSDVALGVPLRDRELALQRWLDLERATVLHGLVGTRVQLSVLEECHLLFLVRSSAKMMCEAALLLESNGVN